MRALGTSMYLLTVCVGTYMAVALNLIIGAITDGSWIASNPIYGHYDYYFWTNVVILFLGLGLFYAIGRNYKEKPIMDVDKVWALGFRGWG